MSTDRFPPRPQGPTRVEWVSADDAPEPTNAKIGDRWSRGGVTLVLTETGWEPAL
jgi:hypothetical protein